MTASEPPWEEIELSFIVNIMQVASAKHKGIISPEISQGAKALCSMASYDWANGGLVDTFLTL